MEVGNTETCTLPGVEWMEGTDLTVTAATVNGVTRSAIQKPIAEGRVPARLYTGPGLKRAVWLIKREDVAAWEPVTPHERGRRAAAVRYGKE